MTAITQRIKPDDLPTVDDEATILVEYPKAQGIIQASWNWPFGRKDLEVYGATRLCDRDRRQLASRAPAEASEQPQTPAAAARRPSATSSRTSRRSCAARRTPSGLSSLENNLIVNEILDAARESARTGRTIRLAR